jgi:hypothetical protein
MNRFLLTTSVIALSVGIALCCGRLSRKPRNDAEPRSLLSPGSELRPHSNDVAAERDAARKLLLYAVPPAWITAGLADWLCHRATRIETTAGAKESLMHLLMQAELGIPVLMMLFLEVTPPVILCVAAAFVAHEATVYWDLTYTQSRREIPPIEQQVHAYLELLPLVAITLIAVMHWPETKSLFGRGTGPVDWSLRLRENPLPWRYRITLLTAVGLFSGIPYTEELWRGLRANRGRLVPDPRP